MGDCFGNKYEYLDHTADVQIHAWGDDLKEAFESAATALAAYITDLEEVEINQKETIKVEAEDMNSLLYRFLNEVLFLFNAEPNLVSKRVRILDFHAADENYSIKAECYGEVFLLGKHPQGTEIKAITYSAMKIIDEPGNHEVFFIVDI